MRMAACSILTSTSICATAFAAPVPVPDNLVLEQCTEATVDVLANDVDQAEALPLMLAGVSQVSHGTASIVAPGTIRFVSREQTGTEVLTYIVRNRMGEVSSGQLAITVSPGNRCS